MFRNMLIALCLVALATPLWAVEEDVFTITLVIPTAIDVNWQETEIDFSSADGSDPGNADYYRPFSADSVRGVYDLLCAGPSTWPNTCDKASTDPFANGWYESRDAAWVWFQANADAKMQVAASGNLKNTTTAHELPTWYTIAGSGYDDGFWMGSGWQNAGNIPFDGPGVYAMPTHATPTMKFDDAAGASYFFPWQFPFTTGPDGSGTTETMNLPGTTSGNILWHARVERNSDWPETMDDAGTYTSTLTVTFALGSY